MFCLFFWAIKFWSRYENNVNSLSVHLSTLYKGTVAEKLNAFLTAALLADEWLS